MFLRGVFLIYLGPNFGRDDVTDDVIIESSECSGKFRKSISVTLPKVFGQIAKERTPRKCIQASPKCTEIHEHHHWIYLRHMASSYIIFLYVCMYVCMFVTVFLGNR